MSSNTELPRPSMVESKSSVEVEESLELYVFERSLENSNNTLNPSKTTVPKQRHHIALHLDFSTFMFICQKTKTDFFSLDWQPSLELLGKGGGGDINQSYQNLNFSYAFKRINLERNLRNEQDWESSIYTVLITEVAILQHPSLRKHPNIVDLIGITWDVTVNPPGQIDNFSINPVFIFEKAKYGSLSEYVKTFHHNSQVSFDDRLKICKDIGSAIQALHAQRIVHSDIKPDNVLVFSDTSDAAIPKVIDFGFSCIFVDAQDRHPLAYTPGWNAPESTGFTLFTFEDAKKTDIFSWAKLCFWVLFEVNPGQPLSREYLKNLQAPFQILDYLDHFSKLCLAVSSKRISDIQVGLEVLEKARGIVHSEAAMEEASSLAPSDFHGVFDVSLIFGRFQQSHFLVRKKIVSELEKKARAECQTCSKQAAFQLALCFQYAFGCPRNDRYSQQWLKFSGKSLEDMRILKESAKKHSVMYRQYHGSLREDSGPTARKSHYDQNYAVSRISSQALSFLRMETNGKIGLTDGPAYVSYFLLQDSLASLLAFLGHFEEALACRKEILDYYEWQPGQKTGSRHDYLSSKSSVATMMWRQKQTGHRNEALKMQREVVAEAASMFGQSSGEVRTAQKALLRMLAIRTDLAEEANTIYENLLDGMVKVFGSNHREIASLKNEYAAILYWNGRSENNKAGIERAVAIQKEAFQNAKVSWGEDDLATATIMNNLNQMMVELGDKGDALNELIEFNRKVLRTRYEVLGPKHHSTLQATDNLALSLQDRGDFKEAAQLMETVIKARQDMVLNGPLDHRHTYGTIIMMDDVADIFDEHYNERLDDGVQYRKQVIEGYERFSGSHPNFEENMQLYKTKYVMTLSLLAEYSKVKTTPNDAVIVQQNILNEALKMVGKEDSLAAKAANDLVDAYLRLGYELLAENQLDLAAEAHTNALETVSEYRGSSAKRAIYTKRCIAHALAKHGHYQEAINIRREVLSTVEQHSANSSGAKEAATSLILVLSEHAKSLLKIRKPEEAMCIYEECVSLCDTYLKSNDELRLVAKQNVAKTYYRLGNHERAIELEKSVVESAIATFGEESNTTLGLKRSLALMLKFVPSHEESIQTRHEILQRR